ncbi:MAG: methyltransferase domain-containing protein [Notoacmeibacter sp.]|nr:methyltransferase domain-containing protein [Notoacmeibacter sp.]
MSLLPGIRKFLSQFDDELKFFRGWMDNTKAVGSVTPTSKPCARAMASVVNPASGLPVLELGPGTGPITRAILDRGVKPEDLWSVEYSEDFFEYLKREIPGVNFLRGDAFELDGVLGEKKDTVFDCVVSAVPLLNFPMANRVALVEDLLARIPVGRPVMQITYGPKSPVPAGSGNFSVKHHDFILRNVPPANLWIYRRGD